MNALQLPHQNERTTTAPPKRTLYNCPTKTNALTLLHRGESYNSAPPRQEDSLSPVWQRTQITYVKIII